MLHGVIFNQKFIRTRLARANTQQIDEFRTDEFYLFFATHTFAISSGRKVGVWLGLGLGLGLGLALFISFFISLCFAIASLCIAISNRNSP